MAPPTATVEAELETHRRELNGYCYRMLGSGLEAEDAVQETMVRAWRGIDRFEGRAALRSWLYRIATNVCLDMLRTPQRRARPMDLGPASTVDSVFPAGLPEHTWVQPVPDARVVPDDRDPAEIVAQRESIRLAFVAALQHLPPRQRVVLILREVLHWRATEVAELLDTSVASVNSARQRARATLDTVDVGVPVAMDAEHQLLLDRYVDAFSRYDVEALVALLRDDVQFSMPPHPMWLEGPDQVAGWLLGPGAGCRGSQVLVTEANGAPAVATYRPTDGRAHLPFAIQVIEMGDGSIAGVHNFLYPELFPYFGLPDRIEP